MTYSNDICTSVTSYADIFMKKYLTLQKIQQVLCFSKNYINIYK